MTANPVSVFGKVWTRLRDKLWQPALPSLGTTPGIDANPNCVIRVGSRVHLVFDIAREVFHGGWQFVDNVLSDYQQALAWLQARKPSGNERIIVLLEWDRNSNMKHVMASLRQGRNIIPVLCAFDTVEGDKAVEAIEAGAVDVLGPEDKALIEDHLRKISTDQSTYERFRKIVLPRRKNLTAFAIIPYRDDFLVTWQVGVLPAMEKLGIKVTLAKDYPSIQGLSDKVREMIEESDLVMADISLLPPGCGKKPSSLCRGLHNPNVYYEIGYARGRSKPTIVMRRALSEAMPPTDLQEIEYQTYYDMTHASLLLYHGLKR